ncbi:Claspin, partial [Ophiophagus hannah]
MIREHDPSDRSPQSLVHVPLLGRGIFASGPCELNLHSDEEICTRKRIKCRRVLADSNSEGEDGTPEKLKVAAGDAENTKGKYNWLAENGEDFPFNDSGCLLTDKELFDNGLEEEEDGSPFQVGNLEMSNTAEKMKTKKRKVEAAMTLPYHLPEAKSVQEFFKHKPRPSFQGSAMTLLKSMKTQPDSFKAGNVTGNSSISCHNNGQEQPLQPGVLDQPILDFANPLAASLGSSSAEETEHLIGDCFEEDKQNDDSKTEFSDDLNSRKEGELNEVPADSIKPPEEKLEGNIVEEREAQSLELPVVAQEPIQGLEPLVEIPGDKIKKSRLDRLRKLGVDLSIKPKLCSGMETFIDLDEPEPNRELEALKERFVKHALHTPKPKAERVVSVNIIRKQMMSNGEEELKADVVPVMLATEMVEDAARTKPGMIRRAQIQGLMYRIGSLGSRMVDTKGALPLISKSNKLPSDPDGLGEMEEEHEELGENHLEDDKETDKESADEDEAANVGLPCSAALKPSSTESTLLLFKDNSSKIGYFEKSRQKATALIVHPKPYFGRASSLITVKRCPKHLDELCFLAGEKVELEEALNKRAEKQEIRFQIYPEVPSAFTFIISLKLILFSILALFLLLDDEDSFLLPTLAKENSHNSSFELIGSMIPSYQPCNKQMGRGGHFFSAIGTARSPSPGFFKTSFISSASKQSSGKTSEPSLPIEDSQDLYNVTPEEKSPVPTGGRFQFQFSLEDDTQSQLLDADGFLNVGPHRNKYQSCKSRLPLASMDENAMDANIGELFDLYSGQNQHSPNPGSGKKSDMEELLHLCSGKFPSQDSPLQASSATSKLKKKRRTKDPGEEPLSLFSNSFPTEREAEDKEEEEEFGEFQLLTDDHPFDSEEEDERSKEEEEEEEESDQEEERDDELEFDDEEEELKRREGRKNKFNLQDFMEDEAELSGSEGGSEDEYDGEELNEYEEDVLDEVLPADGELHDQVNKIHMKMMLDDDKRQLRLYQEKYLLDGDLHSDGPGRMRKFRWKNIAWCRLVDGDFVQPIIFFLSLSFLLATLPNASSSAYSQSTKGEEEEDVDEDSQFMRLAKKFTNKSLQKKAPCAVAVQEIKSLPRNPFESFQPGSKPRLKNGSLLNQPRAVLQKLAAMSDLNPNAPRNSRNFVFQTLSPVKSEGVKEKAKPQVKRRTLPPVAVPSPKRLRLDSTSVQETRSIFQYLER